MSFIPITINEYVKKHIEINPSENEKDLRDRLNNALSDYQKGIKCNCGNDIWVIGSASIGNNCFSCITGESQPNQDFEIGSAIRKEVNLESTKNIDEYKEGSQINGFYDDDDGSQINMDLISKPSLCASCIKNDNPNEELFCNMTRYDQKNDDEFKCYAYININGEE